ncbi:MAG: guanylate kinase [Nitrospinales bacterium]
MNKKTGSIFILSAPSGTGKTTICNILKETVPNLKFSVSHTSREPREDEENGVHYHFISEDYFKTKIENGDFLEWVNLHGAYYGTSLEDLNKTKSEGINQILELDTQGVELLRSKDFDATYIFILPPSLKALEKRLIKRGTESKEKIKERMDVGKKEIMKYEIYDFVVTNIDLDESVDLIKSIMKAEGCKTKFFLT